MIPALVSRQAPGPPGPPPSPEYLAENIAPKLLAIDCTLFGLAMITVLMRYYVRIFMLKMFGWDDVMMLISAILSITCLALFVKLIELGLGKHVEALTMGVADPTQLIYDIFAYMYFYSLFIIFAYSFIKLSIGFFLLRLADRTRWRRFLQGTIGFLIIFTLGSTLAIIFQCIPVRAGWDHKYRAEHPETKCYDPEIFKNVGVFNSSINIATDLLFALIPIPMIWKLQVNFRTKVGLGVILGLGFFASAIAIYKTPMQYNFFKEPDWSGKGSWYYIWQQVEMNVGIMAACLPTLKPLFANFFGHIRAMTSGSQGRSTGLSKPYNSNGYFRQNEPTDRSFALKEINSSLASTAQQGAYSAESPTVYGGSNWESRRQSKGGESDESILPLQGAPHLQPKGRVIIRTTEVNVS
ncbi:hypothetical protein BS50DRAFT_670466 [Corynespora cassiicola Philippines]|uniref:Rhodopsin domain-containing protein n=1 Tax=Corynespora cassiicola Philippines TaxID=1448308 RepID=A0A2T2P8S5_CORCC|nr:hypothetical protein BS50DRAFT_670466 [Corynespora cassiicola Philippines]